MISVTAASVVLLTGSALATTLTTITPCVGCPASLSGTPITVTAQYQTVSTCAPTTACVKGGLCQTSYPYETYAYVSTVIPGPVDGSGKTGSITVTRTDQPITISQTHTTVTSFEKPAGHPYARPTPVVSTIGQEQVVPFNEVGPLAIPGYDGSGLCTDCAADGSGVVHQAVPVTECTAGPAGTKCVQYTHTLVSSSAPAATTTSAAVCSTRFNAPSAGTYTFNFPHNAPARTFSWQGRTFTVGPRSFNVPVTRTFGHGGWFNFKTTVHTAVTQTVPPYTDPATATHPAAVPPYWGHRWGQPTSSASADPSSSWPDRTSSATGSKTGTWGPSSAPATTTPKSDPTGTSPTWTGTSPTGSISDHPTGSPTDTSGTWTATTTSPTDTKPGYPTTTGAVTDAPNLGQLPPTATPFYATANVANARYRKRAIEYLGFSGGDGILVGDVNDAHKFYLVNGYLLDGLNGEYVGTDATSGNAALEEFTDPAQASNHWSQSGTTLNFAGATFCKTSDNAIFIVLSGSAPAGCVPIIFQQAPISKTTTTKPTTTTHYPQQSGYLMEREMASQEQERAVDPESEEEVVDKRALRKRHGLLHKH